MRSVTATRSRYHPKMVSGITILINSLSTLRAIRCISLLTGIFVRRSADCIPGQLLAQNLVLDVQIRDDLLLLAIDPGGQEQDNQAQMAMLRP